MNKTKDLPAKVKGGSPISRQRAYSMAAAYFPQSLKSIAELLTSKNPSVRLGACKLVYETVLPQKACLELSTEDNKSLDLSDEKLLSLIHDKLKQLGVGADSTTDGGAGKETSPEPAQVS